MPVPSFFTPLAKLRNHTNAGLAMAHSLKAQAERVGDSHREFVGYVGEIIEELEQTHEAIMAARRIEKALRETAKKPVTSNPSTYEEAAHMYIAQIERGEDVAGVNHAKSSLLRMARQVDESKAKEGET